MDKEAARWIVRLRLKKHPEGGYFRETYRAATTVDFNGRHGKRNISSSIYYLLVGAQISAFHKIRSDEIWHYYAGGSLSLYKIKDGRMSKSILGIARRQTPQALVEKDCWMAASIDEGDFCLVGCTVSPGFDIRDWEIGSRSQLITLYPRYKKIIERHATV